MTVRPYDRTTVRPYDCTTVQGATFNMRGHLYRGHANATAFSSRPVVSALSSESDDPGSSPGRGKALCPWELSLFRINLSSHLEVFWPKWEVMRSSWNYIWSCSCIFKKLGSLYFCESHILPSVTPMAASWLAKPELIVFLFCSTEVSALSSRQVECFL